jgi:hypothetical protein
MRTSMEAAFAGIESIRYPIRSLRLRHELNVHVKLRSDPRIRYGAWESRAAVIWDLERLRARLLNAEEQDTDHCSRALRLLKVSLCSQKLFIKGTLLLRWDPVPNCR